MVIAAAVVVASAAYGMVRLTAPGSDVPTVEVKRGEFVDAIELRGEAKALKSVSITAPFRAGDLQIIKLVANGAQVKKGDVVVEFDQTKVRQDLAQDRTALRSADAQINQTRAQARLTDEQDQTDLLKAQYDVEEAKLDASKQEILSKIDGEEAQLALADARQRLLQAEAKVKSDRAGSAADLEDQKQKRAKALYDVQQAERTISVLTLRAPIDGIVTLMHNWRAQNVFGSAPEFKDGDRAWPGAEIAELPDLSSLRLDARIDETQRSQVRAGQPATVRVDALPDRELEAQVAQIGALASTDFSGGWPFPRNFDVEFHLTRTDPRLRPGMSATLRVEVDRIPNAILIPADASFLKSGRTVAYVQHGSKFEERVIEVARQSAGQLLISSGLKRGERVALKDPSAVD